MRISELPVATEVSIQDALPILQEGDNKRVSLDKLVTLVSETIPAGKSAYELAVEEGFEGDIQAFFLSLKGNDGEDATGGSSSFTLFELESTTPLPYTSDGDQTPLQWGYKGYVGTGDVVWNDDDPVDSFIKFQSSGLYEVNIIVNANLLDENSSAVAWPDHSIFMIVDLFNNKPFTSVPVELSNSRVRRVKKFTNSMGDYLSLDSGHMSETYTFNIDDQDPLSEFRILVKMLSDNSTYQYANPTPNNSFFKFKVAISIKKIGEYISQV